MDGSDIAKEILGALEDLELRRNLYRPESILTEGAMRALYDEREEVKRARQERAYVCGVPVIVSEFLPKDYFCGRAHPLNQTGRDELWLRPASLGVVCEWIDAWADAQELAGVQ